MESRVEARLGLSFRKDKQYADNSKARLVI